MSGTTVSACASRIGDVSRRSEGVSQILDGGAHDPDGAIHGGASSLSTQSRTSGTRSSPRATPARRRAFRRRSTRRFRRRVLRPARTPPPQDAPARRALSRAEGRRLRSHALLCSVRVTSNSAIGRVASPPTASSMASSRPAISESFPCSRAHSSRCTLSRTAARPPGEARPRFRPPLPGIRSFALPSPAGKAARQGVADGAGLVGDGLRTAATRRRFKPYEHRCRARGPPEFRGAPRALKFTTPSAQGEQASGPSRVPRLRRQRTLSALRDRRDDAR